MKTIVVPLRGIDGKSRLGVKHGGPLSDQARRQLIEAMLEDLMAVISDSGVFDQAVIATPANATETLKFCAERGYDTLSLEKPAINEQFAELQHKLHRSERLMSLASDLPLVTTSYLRQLDVEMDQLTQKHGKGVIINCSRGLGSATIYLSPPDIHPFTLEIGPSNLLTQLALIKHKKLPLRVTTLGEGVFDIDTAADLIEVYYLLGHHHSRFASKTKTLLNRYKWEFLLPTTKRQQEVTELFVRLLRSYTDQQIIEAISDKLRLVRSCALLTEFRKDQIIIYVSPIELLSELIEEIANRVIYSAVSYTITRNPHFTWQGRSYDLKISGYGVPCNKLGKAWLGI